MKVPRFWRAYSQLKSAVRTLPICSCPVGEGANRTRTFPFSAIALMVTKSRRGDLEESTKQSALSIQPPKDLPATNGAGSNPERHAARLATAYGQVSCWSG